MTLLHVELDRPSRRRTPLEHATTLIGHVCRLAGDVDLIGQAQRDGRRTGLSRAIAQHDTPALFDWLMTVVSYQGISDQVAATYIEQHGNASWHDIAHSLAAGASCPKLKTYWQFSGCRFHKGNMTCGEPSHIGECRLPAFELRNGRLNQTAYALYFFMRDIAGGDLVDWIDRQIETAGVGADHDPFGSARLALVGPLGHVHGISVKVVSMALASLMMAAPARLRHWRGVAASMIVVDSLVHNFLHRTGILDRFKADHLYGPGCNLPGRCLDIVRNVASEIDGRQFNETFPANFPRFVQSAIWTYCAQEHLNVCNGNQIDDSHRCKISDCSLFLICDRRRLGRQAEK